MHDGKFENERIIIERHGKDQRQTLKDKNETKEYEVEWISDCEYYLKDKSNNAEWIKVKIVSVTEDGFECYSSGNVYSFKSKFKRVKDN